MIDGRKASAGRRLAWTVAGVGLVILAAIAWWMVDRPGGTTGSGTIVVVEGGRTPGAVDAARPDPTGREPPAAPAGRTLDDRGRNALRLALVDEFPTLEKAAISCADVCTLVAPQAPGADDRVDPSRLPYLGRLEAALVRRGFVPVGALMIEETGHDTVTLRLTFRRG